MSWIEVALRVPAAEVDALEAVLVELGALSVSLADPGGEPILEPAPGAAPLWPEVVVTALLPETIREEDIRRRLGATCASSVDFATVEARDWVREFRERLGPMRYGERLWVCPPGMNCPDPGGVVVTLEPGLAFGSGSHPTTALCLGWLAAAPLAGSAVLDWGCGSGVLGIAALALGASAVTALDIDPQALEATAANAARNGCAGRLRCADPPGLGADERYDFVVANILAGTLIDLAPALGRHCRAGARVALSGILVSQAEAVRTACAPWLELAVADELDGWALLTGEPRQTDA